MIRAPVPSDLLSLLLRMGSRWVPFALAVTTTSALAGLDVRLPRPAPDATEDIWEGQDATQTVHMEDTTLIVDFRDELSDADLATNAWDEEPVSRYSRRDRLYRLRFPDRTARDAARTRLRADPTVESVDYDLTVSLPPDDWRTSLDRPSVPACDAATTHPSFPNDPCYRYQWHLQQIRAPAAWKRGQGRGAIVAVIDTGVSRVPDLGGAELLAGYNFLADTADATDDHGHGTHVAGTIAQSTNNGLGVAGVAFGARIMPLKVLSARGSGSMAAIAQAIRYAADHGAHVINLSLGGPLPVQTIQRAIGYAHAHGVTVVAAAGNDGRGAVGYPARYPHVIAVAATQFDEATTFYSNWGPEIDLAAPGGNIRLDQNQDGLPDGVLQNTLVPGSAGRTGYLLFMGTSMAAPHVAGAAALLIGAGMTRPERVEQLLLASARPPKTRTFDDRPRTRIDDHYGAGLVDAGAALARARAVREGGALLLASTLAFGLSGSTRGRKRGPRTSFRLRARHIGGLTVGLCLGAAGLLALPALAALGLGLAWPGWLMPLTVGLPLVPGALLSVGWFDNPLLLSAALPFCALALLFGLRGLRPLLCGFTLGVAGLLLCLALTNPTGVALVPDIFDRAWLVINAAVCAALGALTLRD